MKEKSDVAELLAEAERLLYQDIDREIEEMHRNPHATPSHLDKYDQAKVLFEKVLEQDPANQRAQEGLATCNEMLTPYTPVQYLDPVADHIDLTAIEIPPNLKKEEAPSPQPLPWEYRRDIRKRDTNGLRYTGQQFRKAAVQAHAATNSKVEEARLQVERDGREPGDVYREYEKQFEEMQKNLHQSWKGHGPEILDDALRLLRQVLKYDP